MIGAFHLLDDDGLGRRLSGLGRSAAGDDGSVTPGAGPRVVDGTIVLDSGSGGLSALRSVGALEQRQIVARADEATIVVDLDISGVELRISGQAIGIGLPAAVQVIDRDSVEMALAVTDDFGGFELVVHLSGTAFPEGLVLVVAGSDTEICVRLSDDAES